MPRHDDRAAAVVETHSGIIYFSGDRVFKQKKPLDLGFLDYRRREAREAACHREVRLNRRLAPEVYLGVADVCNPDGTPCEHLVVMRRLPAGRKLSTLATVGLVTAGQLRHLARVLAAFHAKAETSADIDSAASRDAQAARWEANHAEMARFTGPVFDPRALADVAALARQYLAGRADLFADRVSAGRARDGHGDLLADDIFLLEEGPAVLDCLEFDDRLRWGDVLADVAFLVMDLDRLGRPDLAAQFLAAYREFTGDTWPESLAHHYIAYRAQVRAKVTALAWEQAGPGAPDRGEDHRAARSLLDLARRHLIAGQVRLIVIGGLPGTGKSTLAAGLGRAWGASVVRSDEVRKQLAGVDPSTPAPAPFGQGLYRPEMTEATYRAMLARTRVALSHGESVIADASWHDPAWRGAAREVASQTAAELIELRCELPVDVILQRVTGRARQGDPSDATADLVRRLAASRSPWPSALEVDTSPAPGKIVEGVLEMLAGGRGTAWAKR